MMNGTPMSRRQHRVRAGVPAERVGAFRARQVEAAVETVETVTEAVQEVRSAMSDQASELQNLRTDLDTLMP